ncbi:MAG: TadE/TadG family type IV pilus assembly protein [Sphingomonadales bacterium]
MPVRPSRPFRRLVHAFRRDRRGVAAIEFAFVVPILALIMVAMIDFGLVLYVRFTLNENVSASANYAIVGASSVTSTGGAALATNLVAIIPTAVNVTATVNNGPTVTRTNGTSSSSGTASNADSCYCPTVSGSTVTWGSAVTCKSACGSGGLAGKFVSINASTSHTPLFSNYGFVQNGTVSTFSIVQVQ